MTPKSQKIDKSMKSGFSDMAADGRPKTTPKSTIGVHIGKCQNESKRRYFRRSGTKNPKNSEKRLKIDKIE